MHSPLGLTPVLLAAAMIGVVLFRMLQLPPMLAYPVVGVLTGPRAMGLESDSAQTRYLAEFRVVSLMFSIGLEFNLSKLRSMRRLALGPGVSQVGLTVLLIIPASMVLSHWYPLSWQVGLVLGGALAMSSTAIVSKILAERLQLETEHSRNIINVLLFQDLAVVLLLTVVSSLGKNPADLVFALPIAALRITVAPVLILFLGQELLSRWFHLVAVRRSQELFMLNLLLATLGMAALTERLGLSMALGVFLAGILVSRTPYKLQVEGDIKPFRDVLLGLFFVTVGMLLDPRVVFEHWALVPGLVMAPVLFKFVLIALLARVLGSGGGAVIRTALDLAQAGEFDSIPFNQIDGMQLIDSLLGQAILATMLLSILLAPLLVQYSDVVVMRLSRTNWLMQSLAMTKIAAQSIATERHIIICGYGRNGQDLAHTVEQEGIGYVTLDLDPDRVRDAAAVGEHVVYGDTAQRKSLVAAGIHRAAAVAITYVDTVSALKVLHYMQALEPTLPVIVRAIDDAGLDRLQQAGATEVVPEIIEESLMLASHALVLLGVPLRRVVRRAREVCDARYNLLRGYFHSQDDEEDMLERDAVRLHSVPLAKGSPAISRKLGMMGLETFKTLVTAIRRQGIRTLDPGPDTVLELGDIAVLRSISEGLQIVEERLSPRWCRRLLHERFEW